MDIFFWSCLLWFLKPLKSLNSLRPASVEPGPERLEVLTLTCKLETSCTVDIKLETSITGHCQLSTAAADNLHIYQLEFVLKCYSIISRQLAVSDSVCDSSHCKAPASPSHSAKSLWCRPVQAMSGSGRHPSWNLGPGSESGPAMPTLDPGPVPDIRVSWALTANAQSDWSPARPGCRRRRPGHSGMGFSRLFCDCRTQRSKIQKRTPQSPGLQETKRWCPYCEKLHFSGHLIAPLPQSQCSHWLPQAQCNCFRVIIPSPISVQKLELWIPQKTEIDVRNLGMGPGASRKYVPKGISTLM